MSKTNVKHDEISELNGVWSSHDGCLIKTLLGSKNLVGKMLLIVGKRVHKNQVSMLEDTPPELDITSK